MEAKEVKYIRTMLGLTQLEFANRLGVSLKTVTNYEAGGVIPLAKQKKLEELKKETEIEIVSKTNPLNEYSIVPILPISARGGSLNDFVMSITSTDCEKLVSPINGVDFAITVTGDSMAPEYPNGAKILIKKVNEKAFIDWGRVYVLDTCNGTVIKKIMPGSNEDRIKCESLNISYPPFEICFRDMFGMYRVLMLLTEK